MREKGFTIVELLIVVVVIAILATITVVAYNGIRSQAERSAQLAELSQIQKKIQVDAMQLDNVGISLGMPIVYTSEIGKLVPFTDPVSNVHEMTLYVVFDTNGVLGTDYTEVARLMPNTVTDNLYLRNSTSSYMGSRIDTSSGTNITSTVATAIRNTTGRHIGWITTQPENFYLNYDTPEALTYSLASHTGWDFNSVRLNSNANQSGVVALVFAEYHDQTVRQAVMKWLDREYDIDFYN